MKHSLVNRTSPKGTPFVGTCAACGKSGITFEMLPKDECENIRQMSNEEALIEALGCSCNNALDSCPIHGLGPEGREDKGA